MHQQWLGHCCGCRVSPTLVSKQCLKIRAMIGERCCAQGHHYEVVTCDRSASSCSWSMMLPNIWQVRKRTALFLTEAAASSCSSSSSRNPSHSSSWPSVRCDAKTPMNRTTLSACVWYCIMECLALSLAQRFEYVGRLSGVDPGRHAMQDDSHISPCSTLELVPCA